MMSDVDKLRRKRCGQVVLVGVLAAIFAVGIIQSKTGATHNHRRRQLQFDDPRTVQLRTDVVAENTYGAEEGITTADDPATAASGPTYIFVVGLEGVGHHFMGELLAQSPNMKIMRHLGLCNAKQNSLQAMTNSMYKQHGSGLLNPHQYEAKLVMDQRYDSRELFKNIVGCMVHIRTQVTAYLKRGDGDNVASSLTEAPFYVPINANGCGLSELSYPNFLHHRALDFINLDVYYDACHEAGVDCKHVYMYRDPYDILASTERRKFNVDTMQGIQLYTKELQLIYAQMTVHSSKNAGCFGFLDVNGAKREEDIDRFGNLFGWGEGFRDFHHQVNTKEPVPMDDSSKLELVPPEWSVMMNYFLVMHDRVINLCYETQLPMSTDVGH